MNNLLTSYSISFNPPVNNILAISTGLLLFIFVIYSIVNLLPGISRGVKILLGVLRALAVISFLFIFFQPSIVQTRYYLEKDTVGLLIDASRSMSYKDNGSSRIEYAKKVAEEILKNKDIVEGHRLVIYLFSKNIYLIGSTGEIRLLDEETTDIFSSLENLKIKNPELSNIILISDGADNNTLYNVKDDFSSIIKRFMKNLNLPVTTILAGSSKEANDISVRVVSFSPVGFAGKEYKITVRISNNSKITDSIPVSVKENGVPIFSNRYKVPMGSTKDIEIVIYPGGTGRNVYEVLVPPFSDEDFTDNNSDYFGAKIKRESLRILQIAGSVSYDVRFLRHLFKKAPDVDLISFFILRTLSSDVNAPDSELSLIPFPTDRVIKENLYGFDLIIFQDFGFVPYGLNSTFQDLNNFIRKGGALLFITGNTWYRWIGDYISFFEECMPAVPRTDDNAIENIIYRPELTAAGKTHPVLRILDSMEENNILFKNLPELHGVHRVTGIKPDSIILMEAEGRSDLPLLLIRRCEKGRTALINTDEIWRFSFSEKTPDEFNLYNKFINNLVLWLTGEPDKEDLLITQRAGRGDREVLKGRFSGIIGSDEIDIQLEDGTILKGRIDTNGEFSFDIRGVKEGLHQAKISYGDRTYNVFFFKKEEDIEMLDITTRPDVLKAIAKYSGGSYISNLKDLKDLRLKNRPVKRVQDVKSTPLWDKTFFFILIVLLFSLEWFVRRMYGHQ